MKQERESGGFKCWMLEWCGENCRLKLQFIGSFGIININRFKVFVQEVHFCESLIEG
jgi:hypothetical protein